MQFACIFGLLVNFLFYSSLLFIQYTYLYNNSYLQGPNVPNLMSVHPVI